MKKNRTQDFGQIFIVDLFSTQGPFPLYRKAMMKMLVFILLFSHNALAMTSLCEEQPNELNDILSVVDFAAASLSPRYDSSVGAFEIADGPPTERPEMERCTVTLISPNCVITAAHCVSVMNHLRSNFTNSQDFSVEGVAVRLGVDSPTTVQTIRSVGVQHRLSSAGSTVDADSDIAVLRLSTPADARFAIRRLRESPPVRMEEVHLTGFGTNSNDPTEAQLKHMRGHFGRIHASGEEAKNDDNTSNIKYALTPPTDGGDSGSALVDAQGNIIGIHHGRGDISRVNGISFNRGGLITKEVHEMLSRCESSGN